MTKPRSFAPIIAAVLLLLPVLYVGSYLALVVPGGCARAQSVEVLEEVNGVLQKVTVQEMRVAHYRISESWCERIFWPLEQIDRRLRPGAWYEAPPPVTFDVDQPNA